MTTHKQIGKRLVPYLRPHAGKLVLGLICSLLAGAVPAGIFEMIGRFEDATRGAGGSLEPLTYLCGAIVLLYGLLWVFSYGQSVLLTEVAQRVGMRLRSDIYAHLHSLSLSYFHQRRTGALMSTLTNDVPKLQNAAMMVKDVIATPIQVVLFLTLLFVTSWKLTLFALLVVPVMAIVIQLLSRRIRGISSQTQQKMADVTAVMEETLSSVRIVKAFSAEQHEVRRFNQESQSALDISMTGVRRVARLRPTIDFIGALGIGLTLWIGGREVIGGRMQFDDLLKFLYGVSHLATAVGSVGSLRVAWEDMMGAADRIFSDVLDVVPDVRDAADAKPMPLVAGRVEFRGVSFAYQEGTPTLSDICFVAQPGEVVALVGPSGAGKSTLADLVPRFYDPTGGSVVIDGHDIRSVTLDSLRQQIGIVPQETVLFSGTIRDNIAYGRRDATDAEIEAAARAANADSFIQSFPLKYDTVIGERGATLSGGERQRVAIARALLANPRILILDEATSSLDAASEALVQEALETLMRGRTTLVIAHRLSTIVHADKIVVIRQGRIAEMGTHSELMARGGVYAALYETQRSAAELYLPEQ